MTRIITERYALRAQTAAWRAGSKRSALVPTMGALHSGHLALVERACALADVTIVSIYVNPKQFAPSEDFATYPRTFETDCDAAFAAGADVIWAPHTKTMYGPTFATDIVPRGAALGLEAETRPHFFTGVATVCTKLFGQCTPDVAVFGEKDFQQLTVIRQIVRDLDLPLTIEGVETVRDANGLALSSRNAYLSDAERMIAPRLYETLDVARQDIMAGGAVENVEKQYAEDLLRVGFDTVDYVAIRRADDLSALPNEPLPTGCDARILAAAHLGGTR
ncbi:MAG: pantoate--beta-alanine ligase, partial [Pseudomonadota bacterium]